MQTNIDVADICRRYGGTILRRCRAILGDADEAEDALQEILLRILTRGRQLQGPEALGAWIYRITTNHCLNRLRARRRRSAREMLHGVSVATDVASNPYERCATKGAITRILKSLDALDQKIFVYHFLDGLTQDEVAQQVRRSRRTVGKRVRRLVDHVTQEQRDG